MLVLPGHNRHLWLMPVSLLAGFIWQAWPHAYALRVIAPDAILLACLYWGIRRPHNMTPQLGLIIGLFRDSTSGGLLGQHALSMVLTLYLLQLFAQRIRVFALWQQSAVVAFLAAFYLLSGNWIHLLTNHADDSSSFLIPALFTGLCWPPCYLLLQLLEHGKLPRPA